MGRASDQHQGDHWRLFNAVADAINVLAGLGLVHRYADWDKSEFTGESPPGASVWQERS